MLPAQNKYQFSLHTVASNHVVFVAKPFRQLAHMTASYDLAVISTGRIITV